MAPAPSFPSSGLPRTNSPIAAVVIPHLNDSIRLGKCLYALVPQMTGDLVEIVVVDNGSTQDLGALIAAHPQIRFLSEPAKGAAHARNTGVASTRAPYLLFIDADCIPAPDWLATALHLAQRDEIIGGRVDLFDETPPPRSGAEAFETVFAFPQKEYVVRKNFSVTANLLTSRAIFDDTGPFDGTVVEDSDWCQRAVARGWPISYRPEMAVSHPTRNDWPALRRKWKRTTAENYFAGGTGLAARARWALRAVAVLGSAPVHIPRVLRHPALSGRERARCTATLLRLRSLRAVWMLRQAVFGERPLNS